MGACGAARGPTCTPFSTSTMSGPAGLQAAERWLPPVAGRLLGERHSALQALSFLHALQKVGMEVQGPLLRTGKPRMGTLLQRSSAAPAGPQLGVAALRCIGWHTGMKKNEVRPAARGTWYRGGPSTGALCLRSRLHVQVSTPLFCGRR